MEWLNLKLADARSPQFIGSDPVERSTWLSVIVYRLDQENGGIIRGGALWKDRQWQQTCGVTVREVRRATKLLRIVGDDIHVMFYPVDKERIVKRNREIGRMGGLASGEARNEAKAEASALSKHEPIASTEGERKEKENIHPPHARARPVDLVEALAYAASQSPPWDPASVRIWFGERDGQNWEKASGQPITNWRSDLLAWVERDVRDRIGRTRGKPQPSTKPSRFAHQLTENYDDEPAT